MTEKGQIMIYSCNSENKELKFPISTWINHKASSCGSGEEKWKNTNSLISFI